ncbi:unnamed protein product [Gadus morhua 'NCC']
MGHGQRPVTLRGCPENLCLSGDPHRVLRLPDLAQGCYLNATLQSLLTLRLLRQEMEQTEKAVHSLCTAAQDAHEFLTCMLDQVRTLSPQQL